MEFEDWEPFYVQIVEDLGLSPAEDEAVAAELDRLLGGKRVPPGELRALFRGKTVTVAGNGPTLASEMDRVEGVLVTADEATSVALAQDHLPDVLVTDLDGNVPDQVRANAQGAVAVILGHGDNGPAIRRWAPRFHGRTVATTQSRPTGRLFDFGGFTDGDRAVCLADHFGAKEIRLLGWDFEHPSVKDEDPERKRRKLDWAYILLQNLDRPEFEL
ncbi:MAG TPA: 6-hydroxymethylpterin diphosphokinase MptE-like protein [Thermoplasmata archaeon]|nr:6-hydroxymethylpterin diphosphokinase MptE-like protein [Thermoplasmata archaeon]